MLQRSIVLLAAFFLCGAIYAQQPDRVAQTLTAYYSVKDALVRSDAQATATHAAELAQLLQATQAPLATAAGNVAATKDLAKQRVAFATLSAQMIAWAKTAGVKSPAYVQYCPMKKASWLSTETVVKNPYYGAAMLSCGSVTDTIGNP